MLPFFLLAIDAVWMVENRIDGMDDRILRWDAFVGNRIESDVSNLNNSFLILLNFLQAI